jgi:hypothetical protein
MTTVFASLVVSCFIALSQIGPASNGSAVPPEAQRKARFAAAYLEGRAEAEEQLRRNEAVLYVHGMRAPGNNLDRETGLPKVQIAGCVVDDSILGRADGHNDLIREQIQRNGPPACSFKRWERELFDLKSFFEGSPAVEAAIGDRPRWSPDGKYAMQLVLQPEADGKKRSVWKVLERDGGPPRIVTPLGDHDRPILVWGPRGSGFTAFRHEDPDGPSYWALDLRTGRCLRYEPSTRRQGEGH